jgi:hypothetical protein
MGLVRSSSLLVALAVTTLAPAAAHADLPPPSGTKFVSYAFSVADVGKHGDFVVFAYPTSQSDGAPTEELSVVTEGAPVGIGRRSGPPKLYAMKRAEFDAWKAGYQPNPQSFDDPAVLALIAKAIPCDLAPSPNHQLPKSDLRDAVLEELVAHKIDASTCDLEPKAGAAAPTAGGPSAGSPTAGGDSPAPAPKGGCASCAVEDLESAWPGLFSVGALGLLLARRRSPKGARRRR